MHDHPIPQDVTGYRFHIVGNMTLGQFGQLFVAVVICFVIYQTNLYTIIKWPLILFVFALGAMAAFVPIYERPISHWITTFFKILNKPTQFFWRREPVIPEFFTFVSSSAQKVVLPELDLTPLRRQKIHEYIVSAKTTERPDEETQQVQNYVDYVTTLFDVQSTAQRMSAATQPREKVVQKPKLKTRLRSLRPQEDVLPTMSPPMEEPVGVDSLAEAVDQSAPGVPEGEARSANEVEPTTYTSAILDVQASVQAQIQEQTEASVNEQALVDENGQTATMEQTQEPTVTDVVSPVATVTTQVAPAATQATFNTQLPFPSKPTIPNKLVGMVLSNTNELIDGAIVEIHTKDGSVARAVRTNALGQFFVSTPLDKGTYIITVEKAGRQFDPITIELKGKIVEPLEIHSL